MPTPYIPDQGSAWGPRTSGFNPTAAQLMQRSLADQQQELLSQRWAQIHPMAAMGTAMLGNMMFDNPAQLREWMDSPEARASQAGIGMLASSGFLGMGSTANFGYGAQQLFANSGMRLQMEGAAGAQQFSGAGFVTDQLSTQLMSQMASEFYSGGMNTYASRGLDMTDIGLILNSAAGRGVFAGQTVGVHEMYTADALKADKAAAIARGDTAEAENLGNILERVDNGEDPAQHVRVKFQDAGNKIKKFVQDTGELLGDMRDLYGNLPVEELLQRAEQVSGLGLEQLGGPQAIKGRVAQITSLAKATGMNPQVAMELAVQGGQISSMFMAQTYGMSPEFYRSTGAVIGQEALNDTVGARKAGGEWNSYLRDQGISTRRFSDQQRQAAAVAGYNELLNENPELVEAAYIADSAETSSETKAQLQSLIRKYNTVPESERGAVMAEIHGVQRAAGYQPGELTRRFNYNTGDMMENISDQGKRVVVRSLGDRERSLAYSNTLDSHIGRLKQSSRDAIAQAGGSEVVGRFMNLGTDIQQELLDAGNDRAKIQEILSRDSAMLGVAGFGDLGQAASEIGGLLDIGSGTINQLRRSFNSDVRNMGLSSAGDDLQNWRMSAQQRMMNMSLGQERRGQLGLFEQVFAGVLGIGDGVTGGAIMEHAKNTGVGVGVSLTDAGGLDADNADQLFAELTGGDHGKQTALFERLGVKSLSEFRKAVSTKDGVASLAGATLDLGMHMQRDGKGYHAVAEGKWGSTEKALRSAASIEGLTRVGLLAGSKINANKLIRKAQEAGSAGGNVIDISEVKSFYSKVSEVMAEDPSLLGDIINKAIDGEIMSKMDLGVLADSASREGIMAKLKVKAGQLKESYGSAKTDGDKERIAKQMGNVAELTEKIRGAGGGEILQVKVTNVDDFRGVADLAD